jgi:hypothetical protein
MSGGRGTRPRCRKLPRLPRFAGLLDFFGRFRRGFSAQHDVLNIRGVRVGVLGSVGEIQRCYQAIRIDRVGQRLKQLEGAQTTFEQLEPLTVGRKYAEYRRPPLRYLTEQLEPGAVLQPFRSHDDFERVGAEQIEAVALVRDRVDGIQITERSGDRLVTGGILVDDEHTHAGKLPA